MKKILLSLALAAIASLGLAQEPSVRVEPLCGPFLTNVTQTSFTVSWISDKDAIAWVEIAPDDGTSFYHSERPKFYELSGCGIKPLSKLHSVQVYDLEPGTTYRYRIMMKAVDKYYNHLDITYGREYGANVYSAKPPVARTLETGYDKLKVAVVNDVHAKDSLFRRLFADEKKNEGLDFVVFNGDMSSDIASEQVIIDGYLRSSSELFAANVPIVPVRGNHEYRGAQARRYMDVYEFPGGTPYYTFKYGKFFFIVLDTGEDKPDSDIEYQEVLCTEGYLKYEALWLKEVVKSEDFLNAERRIVFGHIPPALKNQWHGNQNVSDLFIPILNEAGVDLMLCGHNHRYSFFNPGDCGNKFPILVNSNLERLDLDLDAKTIGITITDTDGKVVRKMSL